MYYPAIVITLYLFWSVLSGHFSALLLALGLFSALLVVWLLVRMDRTDDSPAHFPTEPRLIGFALWLLWKVVRANLMVARAIWDPALPIRPVWRRLSTRVDTPMQQTLYANAITLSPGTLTTDVHPDHFSVHSLNDEGFRELQEGELERRIRRLGP